MSYFDQKYPGQTSLKGGCGCSGIGDDASSSVAGIPTSALVIGALALGALVAMRKKKR